MGKGVIAVLQGLLCAVVLCLLALPVVEADLFPLYVRPLVNGSLQVNTTFPYQFNFTTNADCTGVLFSNTTNITTDVGGLGFVALNISTLGQQPNFLCEYRNGTLRKVHPLSDTIGQRFFVSNVQVNQVFNVTGLALYNDSQICTGANSLCNQTVPIVPSTYPAANITPGTNGTFGFGEYFFLSRLNVFGIFSAVLDAFNITNITAALSNKLTLDALNLTNVNFGLQNKTTLDALNLTNVNFGLQNKTTLDALNLTNQNFGLQNVTSLDVRNITRLENSTRLDVANISNINNGTRVDIRNVSNGNLVSNCTGFNVCMTGYFANGSPNCVTMNSTLLNVTVNATSAITMNYTQFYQNSSSATELLPIFNLSMPVLANQNYSFDCSIMFMTQAVTTGLALGLNISANTSGFNNVAYGIGISISATTFQNRAFNGSSATPGAALLNTAVIGTAVVTITQSQEAWIRGMVWVGGSNAALVPLYRSEIAASFAGIATGSRCTLIRL